MTTRTNGDFHLRTRCSSCDLRDRNFFCSVSGPVLKAFESLKVTNAYAKGSTLFAQGQPVNGIYMLCQGRVKLSVFSPDGRSMILGVAEPGELLGLSSVISNNVHHVTAEAVDDCQINFVAKEAFLVFLKQNQEVALNAIRQLGRNYDSTCDHFRSLVLSNSTAEKLARLLLEWWWKSASNGNCLIITFTHEEIAAMLGTSRETVTRTLGYFKDRGLISIRGREMTIRNSRQLESIAGDERGRKPSAARRVAPK